MTLPVFQGISRWKKTGKWRGRDGPSYTVHVDAFRRYEIHSTRWRCGEQGRRGYLTTYRIIHYYQGGFQLAGEAHQLAKAFLITNKHYQEAKHADQSSSNP
jgi:hypothetical protein